MVHQPVSDDERLSIVAAALYLAPRYAYGMTGKWKLKTDRKFAEVKSLMRSERSARALRNIFTSWLNANEAKWNEMVEDATGDWDEYFADWIRLEEEQDGNSQAPGNNEGNADGGEGEKPTERAGDGMVVVTGEAEYDHELDTSDFVPSPQRGVKQPRRMPLHRSISELHYTGAVTNFNAPVNVNVNFPRRAPTPPNLN